ncbi:hypothetical protein FS819_023280 [Allorhizobium sp. Av2]|nr:hypothetical protein [Allorhizobium sp. Av2]
MASLEHHVSELCRAEMKKFAAWCAQNWTVTPDQARADNFFDGKPEGYLEGYNAAIEGLSGAIDCFLEE